MAIKDRINQIIQQYALTPSRFADIIGVQRSNISHILSGRNKPSLDFILKVLENFPEVNSDWLIKGEGVQVQESEEKEDLPQLPFEGAKVEAPIMSQSTTEVKRPIIENLPPPVQENSKIDTDKAFKTPMSAPNIQNNNTIDANKKKRIKRIIVFYDDNSFEEFTSN